MRKTVAFLCGLLAFSAAFAAEEVYRNGDTVLTVDPSTQTYSIKVGGSDRVLKNNGQFWYFRIFDEEAKKRNTAPLKGRGTYCGVPWVNSPKVIFSKSARLVGKEFKDNRLTLKFSHALADVEVVFALESDRVAISGTVTNRGTEPICDFTAVPDLNFSLRDRETLLAPDALFNGVEFSRVFSFSWSMRYAWDGCLIREKDGFFAFDNVQDIDKLYLAGGGAVVGDKSGKNLRFYNDIRIFAKKGESRSSQTLVLHRFKDLRSWADCYVKLNFPGGVRPLRQKMTAERFAKLSRAYLAPVAGRMKDVRDLLEKAPENYIVHPAEWMHPVPGNPDNWDAFPNYFPPKAADGTQAEYDALIAAVAKKSLFMPRTSFFYWTTNSDADKKIGLAPNAIIRIDGHPRTAQWGLPGYLMSPSAKPVLQELDRFFDIWKSKGANVYFSNVLTALDPYNNRYDFHPDAPAPDYLYDQIRKLMKRHGDKMPLLSEGGGFWLSPYQAGFCEAPGWDKERPISPVQDNPQRGIMFRGAPEIPLFLEHEYVQFYPTNPDYSQGPYSEQRLAWSVAHGFNMKFGFYSREPMSRRNMLLLRAISLIAREIQPYTYGKKLEAYTCGTDKVVRSRFAGSEILYNPTGKSVVFDKLPFPAEIAPDGFGFHSADGRVWAGMFRKINTTIFKEPVMLIAVREGDKTRFYAPMTDEAVSFSYGNSTVSIPPFPAAVTERTPGVTLDANGKVTADSMPPQAVLSTRKRGSTAMPEVGAYKGNIPLHLNWKAGEKLPPQLGGFAKYLKPAGLALPRGRTNHFFTDKSMVYTTSFYMEAVFSFDTEPCDPARWGEINIVRPEAAGSRAYTRTMEFRYSIYRDNLRFLLTRVPRTFSDIVDRTFTVEKKRYYHVIAEWDGKVQKLTINGVTQTKPLTGKLEPNNSVWRLGDVTVNITFHLLRIGGTAGQ